MFNHVLFGHNCPIRINYRISAAMSAFYVLGKLLLFSLCTTTSLPQLLRHTWTVQIAQITGNHGTFGQQSLVSDFKMVLFFTAFCGLFYKHLLFILHCVWRLYANKLLLLLLSLSLMETKADNGHRMIQQSLWSLWSSAIYTFSVVVITGNTESLLFSHCQWYAYVMTYANLTCVCSEMNKFVNTAKTTSDLSNAVVSAMLSGTSSETGAFA